MIPILFLKRNIKISNFKILTIRTFCSDWEKSVQRDANKTQGGKNSSMQDNFIAKLEGEFGSEKISTTGRFETKLRQEIESLTKFREKIINNATNEQLFDFKKQRMICQSLRQDLVVQRELSGMGLGSFDAVMKEFPIVKALP